MIDPGPIVSLLSEKQEECMSLRAEVLRLRQRVAELEDRAVEAKVPQPAPAIPRS